MVQVQSRMVVCILVRNLAYSLKHLWLIMVNVISYAVVYLCANLLLAARIISKKTKFEFYSRYFNFIVYKILCILGWTWISCVVRIIFHFWSCLHFLVLRLELCCTFALYVVLEIEPWAFMNARQTPIELGTQP